MECEVAYLEMLSVILDQSDGLSVVRLPIARPMPLFAPVTAATRLYAMVVRKRL